MSSPRLEKISHDQNLKNLILDFPLWALRLFAGAEGRSLPPDTEVTPVREEQRKDDLSLGHRVLDLPLRARLPKGERETFVLDLEVETHPRHFSIRRLARYCLDLSEAEATTRIVPVVIFLRAGDRPEQKLVLGTELTSYLEVSYVACHVAELSAADHSDSENPVARALLLFMRFPIEQKIEVVFKAVEGIMTLPMAERLRRKYVDFVGTYAGLSEQERVELQRMVDKTSWGAPMVGWFEQIEQQGREKGLREGLEKGLTQGLEKGLEKGLTQGLERGVLQGQRRTLLRLLDRKQLALTPEQRVRIESCADDAILELWLNRVLDATSAEEVLRESLAH